MAADRSRDRRPAWAPLVASAIVVPTALAGLTLLWPRPQVEGDLTAAGSAALAAAGIPDAGLSFDGRDATISGVAAADRQRAVDAVQAVTGVRVATATGDGTTGDGAAPGAAQAQPFGVARSGEDVVLTGVAGSDAQRAQLVAAATAQAGGRTVVDRLTVTPGAALPPGVDATSVGAAAAAVAGGAGEVAVTIAASGVTLTGAVADDAARSAIEAAVTAALPGAAIDDRLTVGAAGNPGVTAGVGTGGSGTGGSGTGGELDAAAKQRLQASIAALVAGAPVTFEPDSPALTAQGQATTAQVVALLRAAPGARVQVDGFVAVGPGNGVLTAQELSDQRAATVRDALVAGGVPADRIAVTGRGEDTSAADRAQGRRVAITVV